MPRLSTLQLEAGISIEIASTTSTSAILQHLQTAAKTLRQHQKRHVDLRTSYLEGLAESIVLDRSPGLAHDSVAHVKEERVTAQIQQLLK